MNALLLLIAALLVAWLADRYDARHPGWASECERRQFQHEHEMMLARSGVYR